MSLAYYLNVVLHVLAALFWLGGMSFLGVVGAPVPDVFCRIDTTSNAGTGCCGTWAAALATG